MFEDGNVSEDNEDGEEFCEFTGTEEIDCGEDEQSIQLERK